MRGKLTTPHLGSYGFVISALREHEQIFPHATGFVSGGGPLRRAPAAYDGGAPPEPPPQKAPITIMHPTHSS